MADVTEINTLQQLAGYRMAWRALWDETPRASFFHTFQWMTTFWNHFGDGHKLRVLAVRAAGRVIGLVPLMVKSEQRRFGKVRVLTYPLDNWGAFYSPIGGNQAATLALAFRHIATTPSDWDFIDLPWVDDDGSDHSRTLWAMNNAGLRTVKSVDDTCSFIQLDGDWEAYLAGRDRKTRHECRRTLRRLAGLGEVSLVRHRPEPAWAGDGEPDWETYAACEAVAQSSWQAHSPGSNTLGHPRYRAFMRDCHAAASKLGMVDISLLKVDNQPVAFAYNYHHRGVVFGLRMGYLADYKKHGVGKALQLRMIKGSCERGDDRIEMGAGNQEYKRRLRTGTEASYRLTHAPWNSWRSQAVRIGRWARSYKAG